MTWKVSIEKKNKSLGHAFQREVANGSVMLVTRIDSGGAVAQWNDSQLGQYGVKRGDRIVKVNGMRGTVSDMVAVIRASESIEFAMERSSKWLAVLYEMERTNDEPVSPPRSPDTSPSR